MAKKVSKAGTQSAEQPAGVLAMTAAENRIDEFAEDLGRLLGSAQAKAEDWLGQRKAILEHLTGLRDTANGLIARLGGGSSSEPAARGRKPGRPPGSGATRGPGGPAGTVKKKRTMSPEARARIAAAQRARWAKQKRNKQ